MRTYKIVIGFLFCFLTVFAQSGKVIVGAEQTKKYINELKGKRVAVFSNHTGMVKQEHLIDVLLKNKINVVGILGPEHGFRGNADAGEHVSSSIDEKTGIPIHSLYENTHFGKPGGDIMDKIDVLVFDIQDVGLRYYTYLTNLVILMDVCAEKQIKMIVLDRPNPNGHYVDGPILDMKYKSGVGYIPVPIVHGMTLGEVAQMVNGEKWLSESRQCDILVVSCLNYTHQTIYSLPLPPSPNLPNMKSVYLYSSVCFFEATPVSLGRGTDLPFQIYGHPNMDGYNYQFTPKSIYGAKFPPQLNRTCQGVDLSQIPDEEIWENGVDLSYIIDAYNNLNLDNFFFSESFERLVGVDYVREMILAGKSAAEIKSRWAEDVQKFKKQRTPYLLYAE